VEAPVEEGLAMLLTEAMEMDRRLAGQRHECSQYAPSDPRRDTWDALKIESEAAWMAVFDRVTLIKSMTEDLRRPLDEEFLFEPPAADGD
jgi:hypothetical protein